MIIFSYFLCVLWGKSLFIQICPKPRRQTRSDTYHPESYCNLIVSRLFFIDFLHFGEFEGVFILAAILCKRHAFDVVSAYQCVEKCCETDNKADGAE